MIWLLDVVNETMLFSVSKEGVTGVAFSADGQYFASALGKLLVVWKTASCKRFREFTGHSAPVRAMSFAPNGNYIASSSWDGTVRVWEMSSGQQVKLFQVTTGYPGYVIFTPDSQQILISVQSTIELWDLASGKQIRTFSGHKEEVTSLRCDAMGRHFLSASMDGTLKWWDLQSGAVLKTMQGHWGAVLSADLSADSRQVVSGGMDKTVQLWSIDSGQPVFPPQGHQDAVMAVAISANGHRLVSGGSDTTARIWDTTTAREIKVLAGHPTAVSCTACSSQGQKMLTTAGNSLKLWCLDGTFHYDLTTKASIQAARCSASHCYAAAYKTLYVWDVADGSAVTELSHDGGIAAFDISSDDQHLISGTWRGDIWLWDLQTQTLQGKIEKAHQSLNALAYLHNDQYIVSAGTDGQLNLWPASGGAAIASLQVGAVLQMAPFPNSDQVVLIIEGQKCLQLWSLSQRTKVQQIEQTTKPMAVCVAPDGKSFFVANADGTIYQYAQSR